MNKAILVFIFAFSLFLKVSNAAGAEGNVSEVASDTSETVGVSDVQQPTTIQNTINVTPAATQAPMSVQQAAPSPAPMVAQSQPNNDAASVLGTSQREESSHSASITPLVGGTAYNGRWYEHVKNSYTFGLLLELPASERFSIEAEGMYARSNVSYAYYGHDFDQYSIGGNGKLYLSRSIIQPYVGVGATALLYDNMTFGPKHPQGKYSRWIGAAQAIAGLDLEVAKRTAVGIRGQWVVPVLNRPGVADNGVYAYPYYEEASLMNTTFFRVMGSVRLSF